MEMIKNHPIITVRIWHGSIPKWWIKQGNRTVFPLQFMGNNNLDVGGLFGGHVAVQLGDWVYGFYFGDINKLHWFPQKKCNCEFQKNSVQEWEVRVKLRKETCFEIPVTDVQFQYLQAFYERNLKETEVDYAVFGERCASQTWRLLQETGIIEGGNKIFNAYYPGRLRKFLLNYCKKRGYSTWIKPGSNDRIWE